MIPQLIPQQHLPISRCNSTGFRLILLLALLIITWLTLTPSPGDVANSVNDKLAHGIAFVTLAFLAHAGWPDRAFGWKFILPLAAYGVALEIIQYFVPNRHFSLLDVVADWSGILLYIASIPLLVKLMRAKN